MKNALYLIIATVFLCACTSLQDKKNTSNDKNLQYLDPGTTGHPDSVQMVVL